MTTDHSPSGAYKLDEFITDEMRSMTLEQIFAVLVSKITMHPDDISIDVVNSPRIKVIAFDVHPDDRRMVLGREGQTIRSFRTLAKAVLGPLVRDIRYNVDLTPDPQHRVSAADPHLRVTIE